MADPNASQVLVEQLRQDGYDQSHLCRVLGLTSLAGFDSELTPGYLKRCQRENSPVSRWCAFWLLGQAQERSGPWVDWLQEFGLLETQGRLVRACLQLWPVCGIWLWGERPSSQQLALASQLPDAAGPRNHAQGSEADRTEARDPHRPGQAWAGFSLHLGCGNGLLPLLHASQGGVAYGCDQPAALQLAQFNAAFNGLANCHFSSQGPDIKYTRITVCQPLQPLPRGQLPELLTHSRIQEWLSWLDQEGYLDVAGYTTGEWWRELASVWKVECHSQNLASLEDYASWLSQRPRLLAAFGAELGDQAFEQEVQTRLEVFREAGLKHLEEVHLRISRGPTGIVVGSHSRVEPLWHAEDPPPPSEWGHSLQQSGYHEAGLRRLLGLTEPLFSWSQRPGLRHRLKRTPSQLAQLAAHFLLQEPAALADLLGPQWWERWQRDQLQEEQMMLFPCLGRGIFTDCIFSGREDQVYWLGPDSLALARCAPRRPGRSLDLCTGSGVQAVLNATRSESTLAVDLNPRAVKFCQLNGAWNGAQIEAYQGDLYQPLPAGKFDLITANPPFVPTPREDDLQLFRPGGESGEEVTAAIIAGLPEWLEVGGMLALVSQCPDITNSDPLERMQSWLGQGRGWGLAQLRLDYLPRESLIAGHVTSPEQFERWWDCYEAQGIQGSHLAISFVLRLDPQRPGWKAFCQRPLPLSCCWKQVEGWLQECDQRAP